MLTSARRLIPITAAIAVLISCAAHARETRPENPTSVTATPHSERARVSFTRHMNLALVDVRIAGADEPVRLLLDSGASSVVLDDSVADRLGLEMTDPRSIGTSSTGEPLTARFANDVPYDIGGHVVKLPVLVTSCQGLARAVTGRTIHGILGHAFLEQLVIEVDYVAEEITLHDPATFRYAGNGTVIPIEFNQNVSGLPFAQLTVESDDETEHQVQMLIDSGGMTADTCGLGRHLEVDSIVPADAPRIPAMSQSGLAADFDTSVRSSFVTRLHRLRIGPYALDRPTVRCGTLRFSLFGAEVLHRFDVVFDYTRSRMMLEPNELFHIPQKSDASGMMLVADEKDATVRRVVFVSPNSPAHEAGLQVDDLVIAVDGLPTADVDLPSLRLRFCEPDIEYDLNVRRGETEVAITLRTRSLL